MPARKTKTRLLAALIAGTSILLIAWWAWQSVPGYNIESGYGVIEKAYVNQQSEVMVEVSGQITRLLTDNKEDLQNQKFVIRLPNGQSLLVFHNIIDAEQVPISIHDEVTVRGEYFWTEPGGMVLGTRRDNSAERRHGWIMHQGKKYD